MLSTFRATIRMLLRTPSALVWGLAFPIILATMFVFMFSGFRTAESINAVPVAVVADDAWNTSTFSQVMDALAEGEEPLLSCIEVADEGSALELLSTGEVDGVFMVDGSAVTGNATAALDGPNSRPRIAAARRCFRGFCCAWRCKRRLRGEPVDTCLNRELICAIGGAHRRPCREQLSSAC